MTGKIPTILLAAALPLAALDLREATVTYKFGGSRIEAKAVQMIVEEIEKRTQLRLGHNQAGNGAPVIHMERGSGPADGFTVAVTAGGVSIQEESWTGLRA